MKNLTVILVFVLGNSAAFAGKGTGNYSVGSPPAPGSAEDKRDLATVLELQASRTSAQCAEVIGQAADTYEGLFQNSGVISDQELTRTKALLGPVAGQAAAISHNFKVQYRRARPADADSRVHPCTKGSATGKSFSYPSSHATAGATLACVLAYAYPARAKALTDYGQHIGELRVVGGYHYPTDVLAGEKLGADICQRLLQDSNFTGRLKAAVGGN